MARLWLLRQRRVRRGSLLFRCGVLVLWLGLAACAEPTPRGAPQGAETEPAPLASSVQPPPVSVEEQRCLEMIRALTAGPSAPGAPLFEAKRSHILARAKGEPVLLLREPQRGEPSLAARAVLTELHAAKAKATTLFRLYPELVRNKELAREVLLSEGYLYAHDEALAFALGHVVKIEDLFSAPRLWLQRGSKTFELRRSSRNGQRFYAEVAADGSLGARATLLFLDRVVSDPAELTTPLHRELVPLRDALGFETASVTYLSTEYVVLEARYGAQRVPTLLRAEGAALKLQCEALPSSTAHEVLRQRAEQQDRLRLSARLRDAVVQQVNEALPFDEPRTEFGQEDGKLREAWREAYFQGRKRYHYNEDGYAVFGPGGRPLVPQVCIDFIVDTLERASGTWFEAQGSPPKRNSGGIDFDTFELDHRRRVEDFVDFAERHPEWFEVWRPEQRVPLSRRGRFFDFIAEHRHQFQPFDVVIIYGLRDDEKPHYHSFFIFETDPLTGMPVQLASNAVRPQIRSWEGEMHNAPRRSIRARIRPRASWLAQAFGHTRHR